MIRAIRSSGNWQGWIVCSSWLCLTLRNSQMSPGFLPSGWHESSPCFSPRWYFLSRYFWGTRIASRSKQILIGLGEPENHLVAARELLASVQSVLPHPDDPVSRDQSARFEDGEIADIQGDQHPAVGERADLPEKGARRPEDPAAFLEHLPLLVQVNLQGATGPRIPSPGYTEARTRRGRRRRRATTPGVPGNLQARSGREDRLMGKLADG